MPKTAAKPLFMTILRLKTFVINGSRDQPQTKAHRMNNLGPKGEKIPPRQQKTRHP
jgi:hypothetical protein